MSESSFHAPVSLPEEFSAACPATTLVTIYHVLSDEKQRRAAQEQLDAAVEIVTKSLSAVSCNWQEHPTAPHEHWVAHRFWVGTTEKVNTKELLTLLETALSGQQASNLRIAVVSSEHITAERRMLIMDVDSTLINEEVIEQLAAHAGKEAEVAAVTEAAMRGELDFEESLHARCLTLAGLPLGVIEDVQQNRVSLTPGATELVRSYQDRGWPVCVVSGGFVQVLKPIAEALELDRYEANVLETERDRNGEQLTGRVIGDVVGRATKAKMLQQWAEEFNISPTHVMAIGDGANDLDMLAAAGLGVAFCAKPALKEAADVVLRDRRLDLAALVTGL
ncbi:phosphoserine phosphatase SerB [Micrococcoides hystricis]|uniref:phosphoserine phosphatase n=1 Tax=Micrococcoides hystricis TaxID=1572761 RepID=A0ABV6P762_9MICC